MRKIIAIFAGMRDSGRQLLQAGHRVHYLRIDDADNRQSLPANLTFDRPLRRHALHLAGTGRMAARPATASYGAQLPSPVQMDDSEHFYTSREEAGAPFRRSRALADGIVLPPYAQRHGVLLTASGQPLGGHGTTTTTTAKPGPACQEPSDQRRTTITARCGRAYRTLVRPAWRAQRRRCAGR
jgi:deoxyribodipyrimidine photolyase-related protein